MPLAGTAAKLARHAYSAAATAAVWIGLVPFTIVQMGRRRATRRDLAERLAMAPVSPPRPDARRLIVHAVSAGEAMAAGIFIQALGRERPDWRVIVTCGTDDARVVARGLLGRLPAIADVVLLPWDRSTAMARWFSALRPDGVVVVEPEIWPNLYAACERFTVPLVLVNAHMYPRDLRRYRRIRPFVAGALAVPAWIGVQTEQDRDAFVCLGAPPDRVSVAGNLKFDGASLAPALEPIALATPIHDAAQTIVAGSVHAREIEWILDAVVRLRGDRRRPRVILAPRYLRDVEAAANAARARGLRVARVSDLPAPLADWDALLVDRFGALSALYALGEVAFVGGSLVRRGGHNVLEPASHACAIVVGPHVDHVAEVVTALEAAGGIVRLPDASPAALHDALARLLSDGERRRQHGEAARRYHAARSGAALRSVHAVIAAVEWRATRARWPHDASAAACCPAAAMPLADRSRSS